jgi:putative redox protein
MTTIANAHIGRDHYKVTINAGKNVVIADEGEANGGKDEGFNPFELFIASLGACTCVTVRMYADRKQMNLDEIKVNLGLERDDEKNITNITRRIEFIGNLTDAERSRLLEIANKCPVHKIMSNPISINTQMIES